MARRKRTYRRRASSMNPMIKGIVGGAASKIGRNFHPLGGAAALIGVGYFMKDSTLKTLGSMELGSALVGMTGIGGGGGSNGYIG